MSKKNYTKDELFNLFVRYEGDYKSVSEDTGISVATLHNYSSRLGWVQSLKEMEVERKQLITELTRDSILKNLLLESEVYAGVSARILEVLRDSLPLLEASKSPKDMKTLLDIYRVLNSQPTSITRTEEVATVDTDNLSQEELVRLASALAGKDRDYLN